jgi:copper(I)-binding protein
VQLPRLVVTPAGPAGRVALAGAALLAVLVSGCGSSGSPAAVAARVDHIEILHPYLPDPPSPSVAAVYLTVRNTGSTPDRLVSVTCSRASSSMLMTEQSNGSTGTMASLASLTVPAHGSAALVPGHDHVMLLRPSALEVGEDVKMTLRFAVAGTVTVEVPVVALSAIVDNNGSATTANMKGMNMGSPERS